MSSDVFNEIYIMIVYKNLTVIDFLNDFIFRSMFPNLNFIFKKTRRIATMHTYE